MKMIGKLIKLEPHLTDRYGYYGIIKALEVNKDLKCVDYVVQLFDCGKLKEDLTPFDRSEFKVMIPERTRKAVDSDN